MAPRSVVLLVLVAAADALQVKVPLGTRAAAALGTASTVLTTQAANAAEDGGFTLPTLPELPGLPEWVGSKEAHDLGIFFAQTVISWGVPAAAIGAVALLLIPKGAQQDGPRPLPPALAKALGMTNEPKEYLTIERLNDKLTSFEYSFQKAATSPGSAQRKKAKSDIERQLGAEFQSFNLDGLSVDKVFQASAGYRKQEEAVTKQLEAVDAKLRTITLTPAGADGSSTGIVSGKVVPTGSATAPATAAVAATAEAGATLPERSVVDKIMFGQKGPPPAAGTDSSEAASPLMMPFGNGNNPLLKPLLKEKAALSEKQTRLELDFLKQLSTILTNDQAASLMAVLKPVAETGGPSITGALTGGPNRLDALSALVTAAAEAAGKAKHVYVLKFFGDVTASQVAQLRQEVTAVLQTADAAGRGDEVVLVLNTGGGTVTGYGLAGAQLQRLKQAGIPLTICVEQVAASGGYLMACVADKIIAAPFAVLGSIGVITEIPNVYERLKKEGIEFSTVTAGKYKRTLTPTKKLDEQDLVKTKADIESVLSLFKKFVATNRPQVDIDEIATGETWLGPDALERNMVDELATVDDVLLSHVKDGAEVFGVTYKEQPKSPLAALTGAGADASVQSLALAALAQATSGGGAGQLREIQALLQRGAAGQGLQDARMQMANELPTLGRPMDEAEPMMLYDEQGRGGDSWFL